MNKLIKILMIFVVGVMATSCYDKFENPSADGFKVYTDADFAGSKLMSIHDLKQIFYAKHGNSGTSLGKFVVVEEDVVIKGKVISSDEEGNVYKSLYIFDGKEGIEIKLTTGNYVLFQPGETVYIKAKGLAIGSYRYMLSLGLPPSEADIKKGYANANIEQRYLIKQVVFEGEKGKITDEDILVVNESNYSTLLNDDQLGRLVRFEGITSHYGMLGSDKFPNFLETIYEGNNAEPTYTTKLYSDVGKPNTWTYSYDNNKYYASAWFGYGVNNTSENVGNFIVRTSGYASFALKALPADKSKVNLTGIYTKYSSRSGGFVKYQIMLNKISDVVEVK